LLSAALSDAMKDVREFAGGPLTKSEAEDFSNRISANLMRAHDLGERDPDGLRSAARRGIFVSAKAPRVMPAPGNNKQRGSRMNEPHMTRQKDPEASGRHETMKL
jgi:hypothetical protein